MAQKKKKLCIAEILSKAIRTLHGSPKLLLSTLLLLLVPLNYVLKPPTLSPSLPLDTTSVATLLQLTNLKALDKHIDFQIYPIGFLASHILQSIIIYFSVTAYKNQTHEHMELLLSNVRRTWKGLAITLLCGCIVPFANGSLFWVCTALLQKLEAASLMPIMVILLVIFLSDVTFLVYAHMMPDMSLVVAVVEEECYGFAALRKVGLLVNGRKLQVFGLMVIMLLLDCVPSLVGVSLMGSVVASLILIFRGVVYTVYYSEYCQRRGGEEEQGLYNCLPLSSSEKEALDRYNKYL